MKDISKRTGDLSVADAEIRTQVTENNCSGSLSCSCNACKEVRNELLSALRGLASPVPVPPRPTEAFPLPPSTLPPRFNQTRNAASPTTPAIPETIFEELDDSNSDSHYTAPFLATDLPIYPNSVIAPDGRSETASEAVTHISWDRCSNAVTGTDSEWTWAESSRNPQREWLADSSDLAVPPSGDGTLRVMENTAVFDLASHSSRVSNTSWVVHSLFS